jgi:hypothetical protein
MFCPFKFGCPYSLKNYKLQTEMSALKKELSTSRAYAIKFENDIRDVEHSLKIQKQKQGMNDARADDSEKTTFKL